MPNGRSAAVYNTGGVTSMISEDRELESPPPRTAVWPWVALAALLVAAMIWFLTREPAPLSSDGPRHPAVGKQLAKLELQPLTGDPPPLALADLQGKVALVNFWGPWCPPCRTEFPHLSELAEHLRAEADFRFVSVSCSGGPGDDAEVAASTAQFLKSQQSELATYRDADGLTRGEIAQLAGERGVPYPTTVILGRDGTIRALWFGYRAGLEHEMRAAIDDALK